MRIRFVVLGVMAALLVGAVPASAGAPATLEIDPTSGPAGTVITGMAEFCNTQSASMRLELLNPEAAVVADTGFFTPTSVMGEFPQGTITVPPGTPPGSYLVRLTCNNLPPGQQNATQPFEVTGDPPAPAPPTPVVATPTFTG
jgi:hypothetical protein